MTTDTPWPWSPARTCARWPGRPWPPRAGTNSAQEIVIPTGIALGIAAATPRGLVVPNIKDAHTLGLLDLAVAINDLATTARAGKTAPEAMTGGTTTITNVGVFGVDTGTPILNSGETAILAVGAIHRQQWIVADGSGERIEPRSILQLALSFDHRVIDGQQGSELLAGTAALLSEPGLAVL
ncbi:2-oxo acid dehydrogenase subunit E2 [Amycolatopsis magusensis]|uniref:Pyruvate/2-oxoglutarate dehydrogenase complex dihydrolipoamide acyltransferase (E2) component n=1 Tax=Amycolatopsis magusensis TaxID=882444 RepID=A0ABS4PXQ0_9PSEU|nr:2-oxo acid dehydrogenase subunit E2 [Amycolatopsis magusensis]MBP2183623.1 pyruvate/2-oxoglutarate dehydrogenase complex dihydrolipoamide acyltransferase (E2) component [Amycolatopsis magusensis]